MDKPHANIGGEDEESRLRRKLLERRSAQPASSSGTSGSKVIKLKRSPPSAVARDEPLSQARHQTRGERKPIRWKSPSDEEESPSRDADSKRSKDISRDERSMSDRHPHKRSHETHSRRRESREAKNSCPKDEKPAPPMKNTGGVDQGEEYSVAYHSPSPPHIITIEETEAKSLPQEPQAPSPTDHQMSTPESGGGGEFEAEEKLKKRSKFESTSEEEEGMDSGDDDSGENEGETSLFSPYNSDEDMGDASRDEKGKTAVGLTNKRYEQLTSEEKALLSPETLKRMEDDYQKRLIARLPVYYPGISGCRSVAEFECLNRIEEGTFGVVYRAVEKRTDEVVALKRLKMEKEKDGFPITSLREINMLLKCGKHKNIVNVREIVIGSNMDKIYLVMEYIEHDIKSLMEVMKNKGKKFTLPQVKTLMKQLLSGVEHMHEEYVIHRDLKSSNLLLSHNGVLKIADFGLAREYGDPLKPYTPVVVTLWYRSPELLLGVKEYSTAVDMWSVGCIFGEFLKLKPMFRGESEIDQLNKIFMETGTPNETIWPGYNDLPGVKKFAFANAPYNQLKKKFVSELPTEAGAEFLNRLLAPCPARRMSASAALASGWFEEEPKPIPPELFPTYPAKSEHNKKPAPIRPTLTHPVTVEPVQSAERLKLLSELKVDARLASKGGFALKFDAPKFPK